MMPRWVPFAASALGLAALAAASATGIAMRRWRLDTEHLVADLTSGGARVPERPRLVSFAALSTLPPPVERYFRSVLQDGQPYVRAARIVQAGRFNMTPGTDVWRPFEATQFYHVDPPGYVWDAGIRIAPLVDVRVRDAYVAGRGTMRGAVLAMVDVVNVGNRRELDEGALQRYVAEAPMFPTALLPEEGVRWTPVDDNHAAASLTDGTTTARLEFEFAPTGEIVAATASRYQAAKGRFVRAPWCGRFGRYEVRSGMRVPLEADAYWSVDGQRQAYVTLRVTGATFDFDR